MTDENAEQIEADESAVAVQETEKVEADEVPESNGSEEAAPQDVLPAETIDRVFEKLAVDWPDEAKDLRAEWGDKAGENLALGQALITDHPEFVRIAERYDLPDSPGLIALAVEIARQSGYRLKDGKSARTEPTTTKGKSMNDDERDEYEDGLRELRADIADARSRGDVRRANRLYQKEMAMIAENEGNAPIVNGRRTA